MNEDRNEGSHRASLSRGQAQSAVSAQLLRGVQSSWTHDHTYPWSQAGPQDQGVNYQKDTCYSAVEYDPIISNTRGPASSPLSCHIVRFCHVLHVQFWPKWDTIKKPISSNYQISGFLVSFVQNNLHRKFDWSHAPPLTKTHQSTVQDHSIISNFNKHELLHKLLRR